MSSPEQIYFNRDVQEVTDRTFADHASNLTKFLDVVVDRGWRMDLEYDKRFEPLNFKRELFESPLQDIAREVQRVYHDPNASIAGDRLKRFFDAVLRDGHPLPKVTSAPASWFYPRQGGHWASTLRRRPYNRTLLQPTAEILPPSRFRSDIPHNHRRLYRDILRMLRVFDVDHRLTKDAVKNLILELEFENGRRRSSDDVPPPPPRDGGMKSTCRR